MSFLLESEGRRWSSIFGWLKSCRPQVVECTCQSVPAIPVQEPGGSFFQQRNSDYWAGVQRMHLEDPGDRVFLEGKVKLLLPGSDSGKGNKKDHDQEDA